MIEKIVSNQYVKISPKADLYASIDSIHNLYNAVKGEERVLVSLIGSFSYFSATPLLVAKERDKYIYVYRISESDKDRKYLISVVLRNNNVEVDARKYRSLNRIFNRFPEAEVVMINAGNLADVTNIRPEILDVVDGCFFEDYVYSGRMSGKKIMLSSRFLISAYEVMNILAYFEEVILPKYSIEVSVMGSRNISTTGDIDFQELYSIFIGGKIGDRYSIVKIYPDGFDIFEISGDEFERMLKDSLIIVKFV